MLVPPPRPGPGALCFDENDTGRVCVRAFWNNIGVLLCALTDK